MKDLNVQIKAASSIDKEIINDALYSIAMSNRYFSVEITSIIHSASVNNDVRCVLLESSNLKFGDLGDSPFFKEAAQKFIEELEERLNKEIREVT